MNTDLKNLYRVQSVFHPWPKTFLDNPKWPEQNFSQNKISHFKFMIFFTRELQDGVQDDSGWTRRAGREWKRRSKVFRHYVAAITPMLPTAVTRLCHETLHDAVVESVEQNPESLALFMNARNALGGFRGRRIRLVFSGVKRRVSTRGLVGSWWLYEEPHLSSRARFSLHILFHKGELEIEADKLSIKRL